MTGIFEFAREAAFSWGDMHCELRRKLQLAGRSSKVRAFAHSSSSARSSILAASTFAQVDRSGVDGHGYRPSGRVLAGAHYGSRELYQLQRENRVGLDRELRHSELP